MPVLSPSLVRTALMTRSLLPALLLCLWPDLAARADETAEPCPAAGAVAAAYGGVFYDNRFSYLDEPCPEGPDRADPRDGVRRVTDRLKAIPLSTWAALALGGELRLRYHNEDGIGSTRLDGRDDEFLLTRMRAYADARIGRYLRGYVEIIDARKSGGRLPPRGIEVVRGDILNGFGEIAAPLAGGRVFLRGGRQELLFGAQRLVSPLNWGNTRRNFDGIRGGYRTARFAIDVWFTNPRVIRARDRDRNGRTDFSGVYASWTGLPGQTLEAYALNLDTDPQAGAGSNFWTFGIHGKGRLGPLLWETEDMLQTGTLKGLDFHASSLTVGLGADLAALLPRPATLWIHYDRASGDNDPGDARARTFQQLFPLAHAYFGAMDLVARQNIAAVSARFMVKPLPRLTMLAVFHHFSLAAASDALYNAGGIAIRRDPGGRAGRDVGRELDLIARLAPRSWLDLELGYARFRAGGFVTATNGPGVGGNADFLYLQSVFRF